MEENSSENLSFQGFHGTSLERYTAIRKESRFIISRKSSEYLGDGVYFFENDKQEALNWAVHYKKYPTPVFLFCIIRPKKLLDLLDSQQQVKIAHLIECIVRKYKSENKEPAIVDAKVINLLCEEVGYDVVRSSFNLSSQIFDRIKGFTRFCRTQIQLSVRMNDSIDWSSLRGWDKDGKEI